MATNRSYIRFEAYFTPETLEKLRVKAFVERRKIAEIIREIVERALREEPQSPPSPPPPPP